MTKHNHPQQSICDHELKYCKQCDEVECTRCKKNWKTNTSYVAGAPFQSVYPYNPRVTLCKSDGIAQKDLIPNITY